MRLERFDATKHLKSSSGLFIVLQGRRGSGKSTLLNALLHRMKDSAELMIAMTPTVSQQEVFRQMTPACLVHDHLNIEAIAALLKTQRHLLSKGKRPRNIVLVLDDCAFDARAFRSPVLGDLARNGRHAKVTCFLCLQYAYDIPPALRSQCDLLFALREPSISNIKRLHSAYFGMVELAKFHILMTEATRDYACLVLLNTAPTSEISDCVFWYRATPHQPKFRVSNDVYFKLATKKPPSWIKPAAGGGVKLCGGGSVVSARGSVSVNS